MEIETNADKTEVKKAFSNRKILTMKKDTVSFVVTNLCNTV